MTNPRKVSWPSEPDHVEELVATIKQLSTACQQNVLAIDLELLDDEPDVHDRCGLLADRYEVFALRIPDCRGHRFVVSFDVRAPERLSPAIRHGVVGEADACGRARRLVVRHRRLIDPSWEI